MVRDKDDSQWQGGLINAKKVLKTVTKWEILFHLSLLVFIGNAIILYTNLAFLPLTKQGPHLTAPLLIPTPILLNHRKPPINIPLMRILKLDKPTKPLILNNIDPRANDIKLVNKIP
jgi:hypothetical protein